MYEGLTRPVSDVAVCVATVDDIPEILRQRRAMYEDMDFRDAASLTAMMSLSGNYLATAIPEGSFRAWLAVEKTQVLAGGAVLISSWPAHPYDLECRRATILNVYTYPAYRRRGIARQIMRTMIEWCREEGFARVNLHASQDGKHLYESLGFEPSHEMRLNLRQSD